jgi:plasmid stabilization system protein ParE
LFRIVWTETARRDLERIRDYIGQFAPLAAQRFAVRLVVAAESLNYGDTILNSEPADGSGCAIGIVSP